MAVDREYDPFNLETGMAPETRSGGDTVRKSRWDLVS